VQPTQSLSERHVRERVGARSFDLGQRYYRDGAVYETRRQGATIKARCEGSSAPYHLVRATLQPAAISDAECSCPVGDGGYCKHVAALLLAWLHSPDDFTEVEPVEVSLGRRSKEELVALVRLMLRRDPELESLLETPLPGAGPLPSADPETYRRQAAAVFRGTVYGSEYERGAGEQLGTLVEHGDGFAAAGDHASAVAVYSAVAGETLAHYESFGYEDDELAGVVARCATGLGDCLTPEQPAETREAALRALFEIYRADIGLGGMGISDEAIGAMLERATKGERRTVAGWARAALPKGGG
jgi:hypothetical protein